MASEVSSSAGTDAGAAPKARFALPDVQSNLTSWGPTGVPERYAAMPFASFTKSDRIGKVADFGGFARYTGRECAAAIAGKGSCHFLGSQEWSVCAQERSADVYRLTSDAGALGPAHGLSHAPQKAAASAYDVRGVCWSRVYVWISAVAASACGLRWRVCTVKLRFHSWGCLIAPVSSLRHLPSLLRL